MLQAEQTGLSGQEMPLNHNCLAAAQGRATNARQLSPAASFVLLASITVSFLAGSSVPSPLYPIYMAEWGLSPAEVTVIFGIYAVAVLLALLVAGRLSDHLGRRPVLLVATVAQVLTMALFATSTSVTGLLVARVVQGLTTGAAIGAVGAAMIDLDKSRGTVANAVAPPIGTALGAILAGVLVQYLPFPTVLVYGVLGVIFLLQALGVALMPESISPRAGVISSLKPQFNLPRATRERLLLALPVLVALWALGGFYAALGPMLIRAMLGSNSPLLGGLALFVLAASGAVSVLLLQRREPSEMMTFGAVALFVGAAIAAVSVVDSAVITFFVGAAVAGIGFGAGFQGAIRTVVPFAAAHERAGVLSIIFVISYISMGLPAVIAGWLIARDGNLVGTAQIFCAVVMALAFTALFASVLRALTKRQSQRARAL
ncbi:MAG TPA: MFS transporter [Steroidobacteraceae bacterium]|jgi:MFS family permease|nr:MFS transporter [Steroidobacteraceae bacterium]